MKLSDSRLINLIKREVIVIEPRPDLSEIEGVTVPLHLGNEFIDICEVNEDFLDPDDNTLSDRFEKVIEDDFYDLKPGSLTLAITKEVITLRDHYMARLDGRSRLARLGISVHVTAHRIDPGFSGTIVLEIFNCSKNTIRLKIGSEIGALLVEEVEGRVEKPYRQKDSTYAGQAGVRL